MIRLITISKLALTDPTYNLAVVAYWGAVEVNLPIICACLATIRPLLNRLFPGLLGPRSSQDGATASHPVSSRRRYAGEPVAVDAREVRAGGMEGSTSGESLIFMLNDVERGGLEAPGKAYGGSAKAGVYG